MSGKGTSIATGAYPASPGEVMGSLDTWRLGNSSRGCEDRQGLRGCQTRVAKAAEINDESRSMGHPGARRDRGRERDARCRVGVRAGCAACRQAARPRGIQRERGRASSRGAGNELGRAGHALRRLAQGRGVRRHARARRRSREGARAHARERHARAAGRRLPRRCALLLRGEPDPAPRRHRAPTRRSAATRGRHGSPPHRAVARWPVHRLRTRRQALRSGRRAVQRLRARPRSLREHPAHERGWQRCGGIRPRGAQHGRLRLGSAHPRAVVHGQRPRHAGRRPPARRAQSRAAGGPALRLSVLPRRDRRRSRVTAASARAASSRRPRSASARTWRRSGCASTRAPSSRPLTAIASSSPSTARGTAAGRSAIA